MCNVHGLASRRFGKATCQFDGCSIRSCFAGDRFLNIYDLGDTGVIQNLNVILKPLGSGAFHAAVQLYGREWSFGGLSPGDAPEQGDETGIWSCTPQACKQHSFREAVAVGATSLSPTDVLTILGEIADQWPMNSYDLLRRNCCHFCDEFCHLLGLGPLPEWVLNLANVGAVLDDGLAQMASRIRAAMSTAKKLNLKGPTLEKDLAPDTVWHDILFA